MSEVSSEIAGPGGAPAALPRNTTPTWEVELLISGVAVFAMIQLPGLLDDAIFHLRPRFDATWDMPLWMCYVYAKTAAVILAATFIIHLLLRARWIALVGLLSVHPRGVDWDRLRIGPVAREVEQARLGSLDDAVERADNLATTVFATGVTLASMLVAVSFIAGALLGGAAALGATPSPNLFLALVMIPLLPYFVAQVYDRKRGSALPADGRARRRLKRVFEGYSRFGFGMARTPAIAIMSSNGGQRKVMALILGAMTLALVAVAVGYILMREPGSIGNFARFPLASADAADAVLPAHYDDQRHAGRDDPAPYIQSLAVTGAYLQLVVPYLPGRDDPAVRRNCAAFPAAGEDSADADAARRAAALACLQSLYPAELDGKPLAIRYVSTADRRTGQPALLGMIDVRALAPGRHEITLAMPADPDPDRHPPAKPKLHRIPFWR